MNQNTLTVYTGPMFSSKSRKILEKGDRASYANESVHAFFPIADTQNEGMHSRLFNKDIPATSISPSDYILKLIHSIAFKDQSRPVTLLFDEAQFFSQEIIPAIESLLADTENTKIPTSIFVAGLAMDAWRRPFTGNIISQLIIRADKVKVLRAVCVKCNRSAIYTQKKPGFSNQVVDIGDKDKYEARCRGCHTIPE